MKYRILTLLGLLALSAGPLLQAQDYDDIYYDASKSTTSTTKTKVVKPAKTIAVYGDVPDTYKVAAQSNYRLERDEDEYNRHGAYDPQYEVDINGDTLYLDSLYLEDEAFANTHRIERFYNPDIVILSSDDELVELYYDESPSINLVIGSDWGYNYGMYGYGASYYPWYTGWYNPWYSPYYNSYYWDWYDPWISTFSAWHYGWYRPYWYHSWHGPSLWGWNYWGHHYWGHNYPWYNGGWYNGGGGLSGNRPHYGYDGTGKPGRRAGLATNRNGRDRVSTSTTSRNGNNRAGYGGTSTTRSRSGMATGRTGGNMGSRGNSGVTTRNAPSTGGYSSGRSGSGRSYSGGSGSYSGGSRSSGGSYSSGGSRSSGGSYSSGSSGRSGGGSYSSGSSGRSGGGSSGGSSGGGGRRR